MIPAMSDKSHDSVLGSLPHSRPHRRSEKRAARAQVDATIPQSPEPPAAAKPKSTKAQATKAAAAKATKTAAAKPKAAAPKPKATATKSTPAATATPEQREHACQPPSLPNGTELVSTAVKAAAELAEIGLTLGARALRIALSRLPRP